MRKLIVIISFISVIMMLLKVLDGNLYNIIVDKIALFSNFNFRIWQFISHIFIHANFIHLLVNMLMLYCFSLLFYKFFNHMKLLQVFLLGGIVAGIFCFLISIFLGHQNCIVGSSGAIMAVFFTVIGYDPKKQIKLIFLNDIPIYYLAISFFLFDIFQLFSNNAGGHLAHIGGSFFGLIYGIYSRKSKA